MFGVGMWDGMGDSGVYFYIILEGDEINIKRCKEYVYMGYG